MHKLSVSIVNYKSGEYLLKCLESLEEVKNEADLTIYVVDNNSQDESIKTAQQKFPSVHFIINNENLGFGKAQNIALKLIKDGSVLILNPDTIIPRGVVKRMIAVMEENPGVGISTCKVVYPDGSVDLTAHRGFPTPWAAFKYYFLKDDSLYHLSAKNSETIHEVDAISGSFMMTKTKVLKKVGLFDEDFFLYAEDIDLCYRIKKAGYKIVYVPDVSITHFKGISSGLKKHTQEKSEATPQIRLKALNAFYETMLLFYKKNLASRYPFFINWLVFLGIQIKWWLSKRKLTV